MRTAPASYFTLGRSGLRVSRLALGTMTFGTDWGWGADKSAARAIFDAYVESGGNLFDSADLYVGGTAESWLGEFIAERKLRDKAVLRAVEGSLGRLGTDYIDLYLLHSFDRVTPAEEVMRGFDDLVRSGKVRHVGLSNTPSWYASRAQTLAEWRGYEPLSALQLEYSLVERHIEDEFVPLGVEHGMGIMVWSPLASGLLSGKYRATAAGGEGEGRLATMAGTDNPAFRKFTPRNFAILTALEAVAKETGRSMAQIALN